MSIRTKSTESVLLELDEIEHRRRTSAPSKVMPLRSESLAHRPYRFGEGVEVEVIRPDHPADQLPRSTAPVVIGARTAP
ncbi:hypothetical protein OG772_05390 [Streptomyces sp. NBC_01321]|uniref:hypothetical protein n=1 Tax=unclassified Streptomyces TaxID=2593676 RepID=UPI002E153416|nr:hypothetical protein OG772_05390 [Streptomyces sp. NBC_01321]WSP60385.1 hypothetical protein OG306_31330 [Streptomyces sp. NBC_01241]WSU26749.1 hypothetical protein OG508_08675 [Streptomyces sp. NBC_01108]